MHTLLKVKVAALSTLIAFLPVAAGATPDVGAPAPAASDAEMGRDGRSIIYGGEVIRLSRGYSSYQDYAADLNNIDPTENAHVERLMTLVRLPQQYANRDEAFSAVMRLKFPGYGVSGLRTRAIPAARAWDVLAFEIPRSGKNRYVAIAEAAHGWLVIDDFVADDQLGLTSAELREGLILYIDRRKQKVLVHTARGHPHP